MDNKDILNCTPPDFCESANNSAQNLLPEKSKKLYESAYAEFKKWRKNKGTNSASERVLLAYFMELSGKYKPSSLWAIYSMLKSTLSINENKNLKEYNELTSFLKKQAHGFKSKKSRVLSTENLQKFFNEAPDDHYLASKVALIFGLFGACRSQELVDCKVQDVTRQGEIFVVDIPNTKTNKPRRFIINENYVDIVQKYRDLRTTRATTDRFFLKFLNGKCTVQVIGRNKFAKIPQEIAKFLKLENPNLFTGHCFRSTSTTLKRHGAWKLNSVAKRYTEEESIQDKSKQDNIIVNSINSTNSENTIDIDEPPLTIIKHCYSDEESTSDSTHSAINNVYNSTKDTNDITMNKTSYNKETNVPSYLNNTDIFSLDGGFKFQNCSVTINYYSKN